MEQVVHFLTTLSPARSFYHPRSLNKAAEFIKEEFEEHGLETRLQSYVASKDKHQGTFHNVIGSYGEGDKMLVVGAHYDVCGDQPGADDNGSGIAGLMALSKMLSKNKPELEYKLELVAYTLEEPPIFNTTEMGSYVHANSLKDKEIIGMICLDMIGYFNQKENSQDYPDPLMENIFPTKGNFIAIIGNTESEKLAKSFSQNMKNKCTIPVETLVLPASFNIIDLSDHRNYWNKGFKAIMITDTAFLRNKNYHLSTDTIETLDFKSMEEVLKGIYNAMLIIK